MQRIGQSESRKRREVGLAGQAGDRECQPGAVPQRGCKPRFDNLRWRILPLSAGGGGDNAGEQRNHAPRRE